MLEMPPFLVRELSKTWKTKEARQKTFATRGGVDPVELILSV